MAWLMRFPLFRGTGQGEMYAALLSDEEESVCRTLHLKVLGRRNHPKLKKRKIPRTAIFVRVGISLSLPLQCLH